MTTLVNWSFIHQVLGESRNEEIIRLMEFGDVEYIFKISERELKKEFPFISDQLWAKFVHLRSKFDRDLRCRWFEHKKVNIIGYFSDEYPSFLKNIYDPPAILYIKGQFPLNGLKIGMVGSRKATSYGKNIAKKIGHELSQERINIVSGLARGIDTASHMGALNGPGGTIAVLGTGIDQVYPSENGKLCDEILNHSNSAIITSFPLGSKPLPYHFPRRNRIIAGIVDGIVVIEATKKSGALITANLALENGKDVFAVPGLITSPQSEGCYRLIKDGAKMVTELNDILEEYGQLKLFNDALEIDLDSFTVNEKEIYNLISLVPIGIDEILQNTDLNSETVISTLSILEINGFVEKLMGRQYVRKDKD